MQPVYQEELETFLATAFQNSTINITDTAGDNQHYKATIISDEFYNLSPIARHKLVYSKLGILMDRIHALQLVTKTPSEHNS